jgi:hypothetical protein
MVLPFHVRAGSVFGRADSPLLYSRGDGKAIPNYSHVLFLRCLNYPFAPVIANYGRDHVYLGAQHAPA